MGLLATKFNYRNKFKGDFFINVMRMDKNCIRYRLSCFPSENALIFLRVKKIKEKD